MSVESTNSPKPVLCNHRWKMVEGTKREDGSYDVMCESCGALKPLAAPMKEDRCLRRPLLME